MLLKFGNDFCTACETIARIWHKGNDPIGRRPISIIVILDVHLHGIQLLAWFTRTVTGYILLTVLALLNVLLLATNW